MQTAIMKETVRLLGTSLALEKGLLVRLTEANNLPQGGYFARPANGYWSDNIERDKDDSILLDGSEFEFVYESTNFAPI